MHVLIVIPDSDVVFPEYGERRGESGYVVEAHQGDFIRSMSFLAIGSLPP
jgi:hypothetical protein